MHWSIWMAVGIGLLCIEAMVVDTAFYLAFLGAAAVLVGLAGLVGPELPLAGEVALYALVALASMALFRKKLYERVAGRRDRYKNATESALVMIDEPLATGGETRVSLHGSQWTAKNQGRALEAGERARVVRIEGADLIVEAEPKSETTSTNVK